MPDINVRALAEFLSKPINDQMRILAEQKRPDAGAAAFKVHYYQSARAAIGQYFSHGNDANRINHAIAKVQASAMADHKKNHNERVLRAFLKCASFSGRVLIPQKSTSIAITRHATNVRLFADLTATENSRLKYFLFNFTTSPIDAELARQTLELMNWLLTLAGNTVQPSDVELIDLASGTVFTNPKKIRATVARQADQNLKIINQLWPII
jgi:hypothetical protein